jgi:hypothetical protein
MSMQASVSEPGVTDPPRYWTRGISGEGGEIISYAVRSGRGYAFLLGLGTVFVLGGAWAMYWLATGGELTIGGLVLILLLPGGAMLFGVYSLNIALWLRHDYLLGRHAFAARSYSLFGDKRLEIPRQAITGISQAYSPPSQGSATGTRGDWVTFVTYRKAETGKTDDYPIDGQHTPEEARWLGALLSGWAGVPLQRGFGAANVEADPDDLPRL